ncbi:unnamed protein product [Macrosiphum euphorbiae]|uniref:Uncharacterized protein n=1 Tax=Macrosiphum euphorbiae TaxID=13131 RepID=A0AAV0WPL5_9HEMI|nr:unnamed protein product [Macrosiphum euphorbiae]
MPSSLPAAAVTCRHKRVRSSDDGSSIRTQERRPYSSKGIGTARPAAVITARSSQPSPTLYNDVTAASSSRPSAGRISPKFPRISMTTRRKPYAIAVQLSNLQQ